MADEGTYFVSSVSFVVSYTHKAGFCSHYLTQCLLDAAIYERNGLNEQSPDLFTRKHYRTTAITPTRLLMDTGYFVDELEFGVSSSAAGGAPDTSGPHGNPILPHAMTITVVRPEEFDDATETSTAPVQCNRAGLARHLRVVGVALSPQATPSAARPPVWLANSPSTILATRVVHDHRYRTGKR